MAKRPLSKEDAEDDRNVSALAPPPSLTNSAGFLLNRAGRIIRERVAEELVPFGLTTQELGIMRILEAYGSLSQQQLCVTHRIDRTTMVHIIDSLEERQLVLRETNNRDRRSYRVSLTPKGNKTLRRAARQIKKIQADFLSPLTEEEWSLMRDGLLKLINRDQTQ